MSASPVLRGVWPSGSEWSLYISDVIPDLPISAVFGVCVEAEGIILTKNERGWELPGGGIEDGESPIEALIREMKEEAGVVVEEARPIAYVHIKNPNKQDNPSPHSSYPEEGVQVYYEITKYGSRGAHDPHEAFASGAFRPESPEYRDSSDRHLIEHVLKKLDIK